MDAHDTRHRTPEDLMRAVTYARSLLATARAAFLNGPTDATEGELALLQLNEQLVHVVGSLAEIVAGLMVPRADYQFAPRDKASVATETEAGTEQELLPPDQRSPFQLRREHHETLVRRGVRYAQEHAPDPGRDHAPDHVPDHVQPQAKPPKSDLRSDPDEVAGWCPGCQTSRTYRECRLVVRGQATLYACSVCGATLKEGPAF
jgi:hypothetical protein